MTVIFKWRHLHVKSQDPRSRWTLTSQISSSSSPSRRSYPNWNGKIPHSVSKTHGQDEHKPQHPRPFHLQSLITSSLVQSGNVCKLTTMQTAHKHPTVYTKIKLMAAREQTVVGCYRLPAEQLGMPGFTKPHMWRDEWAGFVLWDLFFSFLVV